MRSKQNANKTLLPFKFENQGFIKVFLFLYLDEKKTFRKRKDSNDVSKLFNF